VTRFTLHVPEALNDGTPVGPESFDLIENALLIIGGGFTLTHGIGAWRGDGGRDYREHVRLYALDVEEPEYALPRLTTLAARIGHQLNQEAVYLTSQAIAPTLVYAQSAA
jgi:hypothetical protein